jgi:RHS repeat-associated protein
MSLLQNYTYLDGAGSNSTTTLLASMTNGSNAAFNYTYDANGNILTISEGTITKATFTYDKLNQLIREDNAYSGLSIDYVYDIGGNIVTRTEYSMTNDERSDLLRTFNFTYDTTWKDQLKSVTCSGETCPTNQNTTIEYDSIGNPTTYLNGASLTWSNGRELAKFEIGNTDYQYVYNENGIRTSKKKTNGQLVTETVFYLNGSSIVRQVTGTKIMDFFYDENGNLYGFKEAGSMYYYLRNGQNDIIGIIDNTGTQVVAYTYDSWGNPIEPTGTSASTIGADNPFRYRGYYFDSDTGLYYLNSRYYDSNVGRFINADGLVTASSTLLGANMYGYCENNPIVRADLYGSSFDDIVAFGGDLYRGLSQMRAYLGAFRNIPSSLIKITLASGAGLISGTATFDDIKNDVCNANFFNQDENIVSNSKVFSFYKGVPVIRFSGEQASFTILGSIMLNRSVADEGVEVETIQHEYGHFVQESFIGTPRYIGKVAIPSLIGYATVPYDRYFSLPWERSAEYFGGVTRNYNYADYSDLASMYYSMIP